MANVLNMPHIDLFKNILQELQLLYYSDSSNNFLNDYIIPFDAEMGQEQR